MQANHGRSDIKYIVIIRDRNVNVCNNLPWKFQPASVWWRRLNFSLFVTVINNNY